MYILVKFYYIQQYNYYFYQSIQISMLSNISVNLLTSSRPQSAKFIRHLRVIQPTTTSTEINDSIFLNNDKIILPVKQYSNKFLRENKPRDELLYNHNIMRQKKPFILARKDVKHMQSRYGKFKNKQNQTQAKSMKTQSSLLNNSVNNSQSFVHSVCGVCENDTRKTIVSAGKCNTTTNKADRISTSRALQMFSKVFKNQNVDRMKIKRELPHNTSDVQIKQLTLQDKLQKKRVKVGLAKNPNINPEPTIKINNRKTKKKMLFSDKWDEQNFQLAGW